MEIYKATFDENIYEQICLKQKFKIQQYDIITVLMTREYARKVKINITLTVHYSDD